MNKVFFVINLNYFVGKGDKLCECTLQVIARVFYLDKQMILKVHIDIGALVVAHPKAACIRPISSQVR